MKIPILAACGALVLAVFPAHAEEAFTVARRDVADMKAVFATVESTSVVPARARLAGTIAEVRVNEGDRVERGQVIAAIGDEKLALRIKALDAQIESLTADLRQLRANFERAEGLLAAGVIPKIRRDEAKTALDVAAGLLAARQAERLVPRQEIAEGEVLAPAAGRVLGVPVTSGSVVLGGEPIAWIAEENYVLRLRLPERHALFLAVGDRVQIDGAEIGATSPRQGTIQLVYPRIEDGRVIADATVEGLGDYFVGQRVRVWISGGDRAAFLVPDNFVTTRFGVDFVTVRTSSGPTTIVPVQRGRALPQPDIADAIELLSGVADGDVLVRP